MSSIPNSTSPVYPTVVPQPGTPVALEQPVYVPVTAAPAAAAPAPLLGEERKRVELKIVGHSPLFYWWPVWVVGYIMAIVSYFQGQQHQIGPVPEWYHFSTNLGIIFFATLYLVVLITNVSVRGLASGMVIMAVLLTTVLFAYLGWWDPILDKAANLSIHMNMAGYMFFSTLMLVTWLLAVFVFDRMSFWRIKPGQITQEFVFGAGSRSYDTNGIMVEKHRDDIFRHWLLGLGSGDLVIRTTGANRDVIQVPNVLFIGSKIDTLQQMIAMEPDAFTKAQIG